MRTITILLVISYFLLGVAGFCPCAEDKPSGSSVAQDKIGIDEILFAPSSLITAIEDDMVISSYLRTRTREGDVPDDLEETLDNAERILVFRLKHWGAVFGWSREPNDKLMEPSILAVDYKLPLLYTKGDFALAADFKYSTKKLPESTLRHSLLDFGVFSITGVIDRELSSIFILYGGATANYIYVDASSDKMTALWRLVPFVGIRINVSPYYTAQIVSEVNRGQADRSEDPVWTWHLGVSVGF